MSKYLVQATWDDVPHLSEEAKRELMAAYPPYQRDARTKGVPQLGSGAIYQVPESDILVADFELPQYYPRAYGMDVGWNRTAAVWGAKDPASNTVYLYSEHYRGQAEPVVHAMAIQSRGKWIPGVIDPAAAGRSQKDGMQLLLQYREMGLDIDPAVNAVEAGIYAVWQLLSAGKLKVFKSLGNWLTEFRLYQRDTDGRIVKQNDHLMDACLAPETLVVSSRGVVPIRDLVGVHGWVLSRDGSWARFYGARKTIENAPVVRVKFADGSEVVCTPDHPFLTDQGWIPAAAMAGRAVYHGGSQWLQTTQFIKQCRWWFLRPVRYFRKSASIFAESIFNPAAYACTGWYGSNRGVAPFLEDSTYTTKITAASTTGITISNLCPAASTPAIISRVINAVFRQPPLPPPPFGMAAQPESSGTSFTTGRAQPDWPPPAALFASNAPNPTAAGLPAATGSAQIPARPSGASCLGWTIRNQVAWLAARVLWRIATRGSSAARARAQLKSLCVEEAGSRDVYCLTVPGTSAFCLANGAVVHNTRYLIISGVDRMCLPPAKPTYASRLVYPGQASTAWME